MMNLETNVLWVLVAVRTIFHESKAALLGTLVALAPIVGTLRVVSAAPRLRPG